jgi:hyperosmotically inducible protein
MKSLLPMVLVLVLLAACDDDAPPAQQAAPQPAMSAPLPAQTELQKPAAAAPQPDPSSELAARVKNALEAASAEVAQGIDVTAANGVVSLFGTVPDRAARRAAEKSAGSVPGVSSVVNKLVVVKGS